MRTIDYSEVLRGSAGPAGMGFEDVGTAELALFRGFHDRRLQVAWELEGWPDLCRTEKRYFTALWLSTTTYGATSRASRVERFDVASGQYFQSLQGGNVGHGPTVAGVENSAWWGACKGQYSAQAWASGTAYAVGKQVVNPADGETYQCIAAHTSGGVFDGTKFGIVLPFVRRVVFAQVEDAAGGMGLGTAATVIGEFLGAWDKDPRVSTRVVPLPYEVDEAGAVFVQPKSSVTFVWLKYRLRRPTLTGDAWDSAVVYTSGRQVYWVTAATQVSNFYTTNQATAAGESPGTNPEKWDVVELPYVFGGYLKEAGFADWLSGDGQEEKATKHEGMALGYLDLEMDKLTRQQGQTRRLNWRR